MKARYDKGFYEGQQAGSRSSAERIVPLVLDLVHPRSVVDIGCGVGTWLAVIEEPRCRRCPRSRRRLCRPGHVRRSPLTSSCPGT